MLLLQHLRKERYLKNETYLNFKILSFGIVYKESKVFLPYWFIGLVSNLKLRERKYTNYKTVCLIEVVSRDEHLFHTHLVCAEKSSKAWQGLEDKSDEEQLRELFSLEKAQGDPYCSLQLHDRKLPERRL